MKFNENHLRVQKMWSRHESVTDGQTDRLTDEGHSYTPIRFGTVIKKDVLIPEAKELGRSYEKQCDELVPVFKELCRSNENNCTIGQETM